MATLLPPSGASLATTPAGRWAFQVHDGTDWLFVNGLTNFEPSFKVKSEDDTDITSDGWESMAPTGNAFTIAFEGLVKGQVAANVFTPDPGMQVLVTASEQSDSDAVIRGRCWRTDELDKAYDFYALVDASLKGGKPTELQKFSGSLVGKGKPTSITKPTGVFTVGVGAASAGTFTLTFGGLPTATVAYNANAASVKSALVALDDGYTASDWDVTGTAPTWVVTTPGGELTGDGSSLTGGALTITAA